MKFKPLSLQESIFELFISIQDYILNCIINEYDKYDIRFFFKEKNFVKYMTNLFYVFYPNFFCSG